MTTTSIFDLDALRRGHAEHDAGALTALYTDEAVIEIIDTTNPSSRSRVLHGKEAIRGDYEDVWDS